jgi:hypothetical protein
VKKGKVTAGRRLPRALPYLTGRLEQGGPNRLGWRELEGRALDAEKSVQVRTQFEHVLVAVRTRNAPVPPQDVEECLTERSRVPQVSAANRSRSKAQRRSRLMGKRTRPASGQRKNACGSSSRPLWRNVTSETWSPEQASQTTARAGAVGRSRPTLMS